MTFKYSFMLGNSLSEEKCQMEFTFVEPLKGCLKVFQRKMMQLMSKTSAEDFCQDQNSKLVKFDPRDVVNWLKEKNETDIYWIDKEVVNRHKKY